MNLKSILEAIQTKNNQLGTTLTSNTNSKIKIVKIMNFPDMSKSQSLSSLSSPPLLSSSMQSVKTQLTRTMTPTSQKTTSTINHKVKKSSKIRRENY